MPVKSTKFDDQNNLNQQVRMRNYCLSEADLMRWFEDHALVPAGSRLLGVYYDWNTRVFALQLENQAFPTVDPGRALERRWIELKKGRV